MAAACSIVILGALVIDPLIGKHEAARLSALIGVPKAARLVGQDSELIGAELGMNFEDIARAMRTRLGADSTSTTVSRKDFLEARNRLKRIDDHEELENIF